MADVEFTIERAGYEAIVLDTDGAAPYGLRSSSAGFGVPPVVSYYSEGAADGVTYRGGKTGARPVDIGIIFSGNGRISTGELIRALATLMRKRTNVEQPKLVATYASGEVFELPFVYESGLELDFTDALPNTYRAVIAVTCPAPYWTARDALQFAVENTSTPTGLLPNLAELPVMSSSAISSIMVENPGDVDSDISWNLVGPGGPIPISVNGVGFVFETVLVSGEVITITRTEQGVSVVDQLGARRYADLGPAPKFPRLPAGLSRVDIAMANASQGTWVATTDVVATNRVSSPSLRTSSTGWSTVATSATESRVATGFDGSDAGFMRLVWSADAVADAAVQVQVAVVPGEILSGALSVMASVAQVFYPVCVFVDSAGVPVGSLFVGRLVEVPAATAVQLGFSEIDLGPVPSGAVALRFMASVDSTSGNSWPSGAVLSASRAIISTVPSRFFDGSAPFCGWAGAADASESVRFRTEITGRSSVTGVFKPRREVVY